MVQSEAAFVHAKICVVGKLRELTYQEIVLRHTLYSTLGNYSGRRTCCEACLSAMCS